MLFKFFLTAVVSAAAGIALGLVQASLVKDASQERFLGARSTLAERNQEMTTDEILEQTKNKGKPKVELVNGYEFDFGTMMHGTKKSHKFVLRNAGDGPLVLEMGESTCKCTVGELDSSILQPGEQTDVELTWKAQTLARDFSQSATIKTNDTSQLEVKLDVYGEITQSVVMIPSEIQLGKFSETDTIERSFHVYTFLKGADEIKDLIWTDSRSGKNVEITQQAIDPADTTLDLLRAKRPSFGNAESAYKVTFKMKPGLPLGPLSSRIQFKTNRDDDIGVLEVPVKGTVSGVLALQGGPSFDHKTNLLKLGNVKSSEGREVSIFLFVQGDDRDEHVPQIVSVKPAEALKVEIGEPIKSKARTSYPIRFEVPKGAPEVYYPARGKNTTGVVTIKTQGSPSRELRIFVRLVIEE